MKNVTIWSAVAAVLFLLAAAASARFAGPVLLTSLLLAFSYLSGAFTVQYKRENPQP